MAIESDVLVVGGGLAGVTAALAAAKTGADVRLVSAKQSSLRQASGLIDVLGYSPSGDGPLADPFATIDALPSGHPYERAGIESLESGLATFDEVTGASYEGKETPANALVPTHGGAIKPTARYPASVAAGLASDDRDCLLVGFERLPAFDAPLAADHLAAAGVPFEARSVTVEFPIDFDAEPTVTRFARLLDREGAIGEESRSVRAALAAEVEEHLDGEQRVGFPAVLGKDCPADVRSSMESHLDAAVFEVPMGPPSLPGIRLESKLYEALADAGVRYETGNPVVDYERDGDGVDAVFVDRNGSRVPYKAQEFVLATGGLVGQGIDATRERVREPIFDCHVAHPDDRTDWYADDVFGDHPFARFGLAIDPRMRPHDGEGDPEFSNLRAAGSVLGGYNFAAEKSGSGVSLATGHRAGRLAGEESA